jgi:hypothetical protein
MKDIKPDSELYPEAGAGTPGSALLNDDEQLANYLASLLAAAPAKLDFSFYPDPSDPCPTGEGGVEDVLCLGPERAKKELRFLGNENSLLKMKVARLIARLNDAECKLDQLAAENTSLKSDIDTLRNQIQLYKLAISDLSRPEPANQAPPVKRATAKPRGTGTGPGAGMAAAGGWAVAPETGDFLSAGAPPDGPRSELPTPAVPPPREKAGEAFSAPPDLAASAPGGPDLAAAGAGEPGQAQYPVPAQAERDSETEWRSRLAPADSGPKGAPAMVVISGQSASRQEYVSGLRPASKVIKKEGGAKPRPPREQSAQPQGAAHPDAASGKRSPAKRATAPVTAFPAQGGDGSTAQGMSRPGGVNAVRSKAAPDTKTMTRKHIEKYRLLQEEADSSEVTAGPDLDGKA